VEEESWLICQDPGQMLGYPPAEFSRRKLELFLCGCCRRLWGVWRLPDDPLALSAVEAAERHADGAAGDAELLALARTLDSSLRGGAASADVQLVRQAALETARACPELRMHPTLARYVTAAAEWARMGGRHGSPGELVLMSDLKVRDWETSGQAALLRDVVGNPFRTVAVDPAWRTWSDGLTVRLARAIYEERAFGRLPFLADALEEAGCDDDAILRHCRERAEHARGCWVVDQLLRRE
jgi:hypothetical protein